jgi:hypothetical protein
MPTARPSQSTCPWCHLNTSPDALLVRFTQQAEAGKRVHGPTSQALPHVVLRLLGEDSRCCAGRAHPLAGLAAALAANGIVVAGVRDPSVRVGIAERMLLLPRAACS